MSAAGRAGGPGMSPAPHLVGAAGPAPGHPPATSGASSGQCWLCERSSWSGLSLRPAEEVGSAGCVWPWQRRALGFALLSYPGTAAVATDSPGWSLTAPAQTNWP